MKKSRGYKYSSGFIWEKELDILSCSVNPIRLKNNPVELDGETVNILYNILLGQK